MYYGRSLLLLSLLLSAISAPAISAAPVGQNDPESQCAEGVRLLEAGENEAALPLLEAGFVGREQTNFTTAEAAKCALSLSRLRYEQRDIDGALAIATLALELARQNADRPLEAAALNTIGNIFSDQGRQYEALAMLTEAKSAAHESNDLVLAGTVLINIGALHYGSGQFEEALQSFQEALSLAQQAGDQQVESSALNGIGTISFEQGDYAQAIEVYEQALAIARAGESRENEITLLNNIGRIYLSQGKLKQALEVLEQARAIARKAGEIILEEYALYQMGAAYDEQGLHQKALDVLQQSLVITRQLQDRPSEAYTLNSLGSVYSDLGQYAEALAMYEQALTIRREENERQGEGVVLANMGVVYDAQGQFQQALDLFQQALVIAREEGEPEIEGRVLNNIAAIHDVLGQYDQALTIFQQALVIKQQGGNPLDLAATLNNIGKVYSHQGEHAQALSYFQQAYDTWQAGEDSMGAAVALNNIGRTYDDQGDSEQALDTYAQALVLRREVGDRLGESATLSNIAKLYDRQGQAAESIDSYEQALTLSRQIGDRIGEGQTLNALGTVQQALGRSDTALSYYAQAMDIVEAIRSEAGSEQSRADFIAQYASLYGRSALLYQEQTQPSVAFLTSERARARAFLDSLATGYVQLSDEDAAELFAREQEAYAGRQNAQDALGRARAADAPDQSLIGELEQQLQQAEQAHDAALAAIEQRGGQLAAMVPGRTKGVLGVSEVQQLLGPQTTLLSFFSGDEQTLAFIITRDQFETVVLPAGLAKLQQQVQALRDNPQALKQPHSPEAVALYQTLIAPIKARLRGPHLAIVPHAALHYVPFAALSDGQRYLSDAYLLSVLPSASTLRYIQANSERPLEGLLILGNPDGSLAYADAETQVIANLYGVAPLVRDKATVAAVRDGTSEAGILHIAAHGRYNPAAPLASSLALAEAGDEDGALEAGEIYGLNLKRAGLVVLSACQTNLGQLSAGDEVVGLTRAFMFAGAPTVVSSLWNVNDQATSLLMERFYTHLRAGMGKAAALQRAQQDVREQYPAPYFWAGFVLSGDTGAVPASIPWGWLVIGAASLAVLGLGTRVWSMRRGRHTTVVASHIQRPAEVVHQQTDHGASEENDDLLKALLLSVAKDNQE